MKDDDLIIRLARIIEPVFDRASRNTRNNALITARAVLAEVERSRFLEGRAISELYLGPKIG